jgi:Xaa-Pro aminopeptidase
MDRQVIWNYYGDPMLLTQIPTSFKQRRDRLMQAHPQSLFIFPSNLESVRNSDVYYPFRQSSTFYYLSGFDEPHSYIVLAPSQTHSQGYQYILFTQTRDPEKEMWEGERYGVQGATAIFGADEAYPIDEFEVKLPELLKSCSKVYYRLGLHADRDRNVIRLLEIYRKNQGRSGRPLLAIEDPSGPVGEMRLFKGPEEIESMRKGCHIAALAHELAMKEVRPGMNEAEVEALIDYSMRRAGSPRLGYPSIVAGGKNAACLHYRSNNDTLRDGELLLIDAGCEYEYYSADITRTFPIGKKFTSTQAQLYDLVLRSQKEGIAMTRPGETIPAIHQRICQILIEGMLSLGLLQGNPETILKKGEYKRFYPHQTSHWLGMDVHDAGRYLTGESTHESPRKLEAGMVFTIEPGFYVQPQDRGVPDPYRHIGIRIEDDILVTPGGCEVLTRRAPKEREEIEALRNAVAFD